MLNQQIVDVRDNEFRTETKPRNQTTETATYVMDLLTELKSISEVVGLSELSTDIDIVILKHGTRR